MNNKQVVAISMNKVQTFLYHAIKGNSADAESEGSTLKRVQKASEDTSEKFKKIVRKAFEIKEEDEILIISGKACFYSDWAQEKLEATLKELYAFYYYKYKGQVQLKYSFPHWEEEDLSNEKINAIHKSTDSLKSAATTNKMIEENQSLLFQFPCENYEKSVKDYEKKWLGQEQSSKEENKSKFKSGLNDLVSDEKREDQKSCKIAVIKADIDKMGKVFKGLSSYETYKAVSTILEEKITFDNLEEKLKAFGGMKMLPFYLAGDDIFFAVPVANIFDAVKLLEAMLEEINEAIKESVKSQISKDIETLKMSIGIDITQNDQPIRYYYDRVECQLAQAKAAGKKAEKLNKGVRVSISFDDIDFFIYENKSKDGKSENWECLWENIAILNCAREKSEALSTSYFYNLLQVTQDKNLEDAIAYTNAVFYWLLPSCSDIQTMKSLDFRGELVLKSILMRLLEDEKKDNKKDNKAKYKIEIKESTKKRFQNMVRMFLLFSDIRYQVDTSVDHKKDLSFKKRYEYLSEYKIIVQSYIFPVYTYLYGESLDEKLREQIIKDEISKKTRHFKKLKIEKAMFFKMKKIMRLEKTQAVDKIAIMLENVNMSMNENTEGSSDKKTDSDIVSTWLKFDKTLFIEFAKEKLDEKQIDSLLVFYEYKKLTALKHDNKRDKKK